MRRKYIIPLIFIAALSSAGDVSAYRFSERIEFTLPARSGIRLSLRNIHGSITVTGWDRGEVSVSANVRIRAASRNKAERIFDAVALDFMEDEDWMSIAAVLPRATKDGIAGEANTTIWVEYDIRVPSSAGLEISSVTGSIDVSKVRGEFKLVSEAGSIGLLSSGGEGVLSTGNGDIDCELGWLTAGGTLLLRTGSGDISLEIPGDTGAEFVATSRRGRVRCGLEINGAEKTGRGSIKGMLGDGGS